MRYDKRWEVGRHLILKQLPFRQYISNLIWFFGITEQLKRSFFFIFLDSYDCFAMIKRNVTIVNMVKKWNNGMSYSTCFCDIFWGDFIWSITGKSSFQRLWLCVDFFFALIAISNKFDFCVFFFSFFFPEPWTEKNVYSIWLSPRNEWKVPIYSLKEEETF